MSDRGTIQTGELTPLHWVGIAMATVSAVVHLYLAVVIPGWLGISFAGATAGFIAGIGAVLVGFRRRLTYLLGIPFTGGQVVLWYLLNDQPGLAELGTVDVVDKVAQIVLIGVLVALYTRES
ncbi:MAG: hypothetical protein PPP55_09615 [Halorubrum sp.]